MGHQLGLPLLGVDIHGAELVEAEIPAVLSHALLREEDRARGVDFDGQGDEGRQHGGDSQACKGAQDIDDPLDKEPAVIEGAGLIGKHREAREGLGRLVGDDVVEVIDVYMDGDAHALEADNQLLDLVPGVIGQMDEDLVDDPGFQLIIEVGAAGGDGHASDLSALRNRFPIHEDDAAHLEAPLGRIAQLFQHLEGRAGGGDEEHFIAAGAGAVHLGKILLQQQMAGVGQQNVVKEKVDEDQTGEVFGQLRHIQEEAQEENQHEIVFAHGDQLHIVAPPENVRVPVEQIIGQQMKEENAGHRRDIGLGIGPVAVLHAAGQKGQRKGQKDAEAFHCQQGIILDKTLFLTDV